MYTDYKLDFTQNLEEATDAIALGRRHSWLASEGFSLSTANADVQELRLLCAIELQPLSLTPLKMRKVQIRTTLISYNLDVPLASMSDAPFGSRNVSNEWTSYGSTHRGRGCELVTIPTALSTIEQTT